MRRIYSCRPFFGLLFLSVLIAATFPGPALSQDCEQPAGTIASVQGTVEARRAGQTGWQPLALNDTLCPGDTVRVGANSRADIALANQSVLRLDADSELTLEGISQERTSRLNMFKGAAHFFSRQPRGLEVQTPYTIAGVRGTEFLVRIAEGRTLLSVYEGAVLAQNDAGSLTLQSGQSAVAEAGQAPVIRVVARPRDAVQWALYYPPVIYKRPGEPAPDESDPRFYTRQAAELLAVGRVDQANSNIQQALTLDPDFADAFALQTIVAIVQNDKDRAMQAAQKAIESDPNSATARIAMSYARQARFDLEGARDSLEKAVEAEPQNALAWARLAEVQAGFGRLDDALESAQKAVTIDPELERTQTVLGFAYLNQVKTAQAREAFEKAIRFDQAASLPRLGLGLAKIREGDLAEGRQDIEIAASLDPNNAIIRSYLGKAYYEEKRGELDMREYEVAKELDPNDPTPYFYSAIAKQTTNRPVEALRDYQTAKELNDNRAVYRSSLQLDDDLAARSSATARIYNELGFGQLGLVEGYNSVNTDPTNFSAHRFLADTYATLPRHEIARVSELLQSQLLQPQNITPIQPGLAESNLFLIGSQGAGQTSFNEFNNLMIARNRAALQASGLAGSNDTWAGEGVVSGIYDKLSLSAGYTHFETDGFRVNNDQEDDIANIFAQYEITHKTSIQGEYRYRDNERGDTQLRFFEDDFSPNRRQEEETRTGRLGFKHAVTPESILLGNFAYQELEDSFFDFGFIDPADVGVPLPPPPPFIRDEIGVASEQDGYSGEVSHLFRSQYVNTVAGAGYFKIDQDVVLDRLATYPGNPAFLIPPITFFDTTTLTESDIDHLNLYLYSYIKPIDNLTLTVGASGDLFEFNEKDSDLNDIDEDQFNPKFGVVWNPVPNTTLRGAAFRTLKRTLIADQTLEPTQVAGFNQFFDDINATETWVYGAAVDQKFTQSIYGGAEYYKRDLDVPWFDIPDPPALPVPQLKRADWKEYLGRAYLYWTPHKWLALKAEYRYEKFERDPEFSFNIQEVKTHSVPLGISFFHPSGVSVFFGATYYDQEGNFQREGPIPVPFEEGEDDFWLADAAVSYRLPKRYGILTLGVTNLFDEQFQYADTDIENPSIQPERYVFGKLTLAFP